jgi:hypothetical protein
MCDQSPCPPPHPPKRSSGCRAKGANEGVREVICSTVTVVFGGNFIKGWKHCFRNVMLFTNGTWLWGKSTSEQEMVLLQWWSLCQQLRLHRVDDRWMNETREKPNNSVGWGGTQHTANLPTTKPHLVSSRTRASGGRPAHNLLSQGTALYCSGTNFLPLRYRWNSTGVPEFRTLRITHGVVQVRFTGVINSSVYKRVNFSCHNVFAKNRI